MKLKKLKIFWNKMGLMCCRWSSFNAPGTQTPLSHPILKLDESPFLINRTQNDRSIRIIGLVLIIKFLRSWAKHIWQFFRVHVHTANDRLSLRGRAALASTRESWEARLCFLVMTPGFGKGNHPEKSENYKARRGIKGSQGAILKWRLDNFRDFGPPPPLCLHFGKIHKTKSTQPPLLRLHFVNTPLPLSVDVI